MVPAEELARLLDRLLTAGLRVEPGAAGALEVVGDTEPPADVLVDLQRHHKALGAALGQRQALEARVVVACDTAGRLAPERWLEDVDLAHRALDLHRLEVLAVRFERWSRRELRGDEPAWCRMRAGNLGGAEVVVVLDMAVHLPPELERMPLYISAEVHKLVGVDPRVLRAVHLTKNVWPEARVVRHGPVQDE